MVGLRGGSGAPEKRVNKGSDAAHHISALVCAPQHLAAQSKTEHTPSHCTCSWPSFNFARFSSAFDSVM